MSKPKNPPAFPSKHIEQHGGHKIEVWTEGMTLRDYFAGRALNGMTSIQKVVDALHLAHEQNDDEAAQNGLAEICYQIADAMLKERERDEPIRFRTAK